MHVKWVKEREREQKREKKLVIVGNLAYPAQIHIHNYFSLLFRGAAAVAIFTY